MKNKKNNRIQVQTAILTFCNPETKRQSLILRNGSFEPDCKLGICESVQKSHEGEPFKAEEHNDVVFCFFPFSLAGSQWEPTTPTLTTPPAPLHPGPMPGCEWMKRS